ncbi:polysaccharide polymerase [Sporosarcina globispora]|uniref:Polysaccharide polymerase n=1 Tax=Sporosarcina globispora TaxID=1459 RepID=A0A0M0GAU3_SPOGL|nr:O-antigen ligase family protein [Sporosarcina globispora]KON86546.1 polysaccharide polymerase [Sporosarcina globispora]
MDNGITAKKPKASFTIFFLFLLVTLANYYIYIGFAIKPYMIFSLLYLLIHVSSFYFQRLHGFEVALLIFYLMYSFSGAFSLYPSASIRILLGIILYIACYFIIKAIIGRSNNWNIERAIADAGIFFNTVSLILYMIGIQSLGFDFEGDRIYEWGVMLDRNYPRLIGVLQDPNYFVFYNTLFFCYFLCHSQSMKNKMGLLLCILTNLLTLSRGGLLVILIILCLYFLKDQPIKRLKLLAGMVVSLSAAVYLAIVHMKIDLLSILGSRIEDLSEDGGSGRLELWGRAWEFFASNKYIGIGAYNFPEYNSFQFGDSLQVHNTFLEILSESGLIGISFFCVFVLTVFVQLIQSKLYKNNPYLFFAFIAIILQMGFLSIIINDMFFLYLAILSTYLHNERYIIRNEDEKSDVHHANIHIKRN